MMLPLINWQGARDGSLGERRVRPIHRHRCPSVGLHVWRNGGLSQRIVRGIATTHLGVPIMTHDHTGRRVTGLSPVHALMPPSHREVGDGRVGPMHPGELVGIHWSIRRNNGLTHELRRIGRQRTVIGWGAKISSRSGRTTST